MQEGLLLFLFHKGEADTVENNKVELNLRTAETK